MNKMLCFDIRRLTVLAISLFAIFSLGFFSSSIMNFYSAGDLEIPSAQAQTYTAQSPSDSIPENKISVYPDKVVITIENASLSSYAPTKSMTPVFDNGANGIRIKPDSPDEISVGDIVTYEKNGELIVHRVIEKGSDEQGLYFVVKGDNNSSPDGKIRFSDIRYKTVAILY
jgi:hypothetical protein